MILRIMEESSFDASTLVLFRKCISAEMLMELNGYLLTNKDDNKNGGTPSPSEDSGGNGAPNQQTLNKMSGVIVVQTDLLKWKINQAISLRSFEQLAYFCECLSVVDHFATDGKNNLYQSNKRSF